MKTKEQINRPIHYTWGPIEVIEIIEGFDLGYHIGNVIKYLLRALHKGNPLDNYRKAAWYLDRYIKLLEKRQKNARTKSKLRRGRSR